MKLKNANSLQKTKKIYTIFVTLLPIISVYASGIAGFTLGDLILVIMFLTRVFDGIRSHSLKISKRTAVLLPLIIAIPLLSVLSSFTLNSVDSYSIIIRIVRRLFYYLSVVIISGEWFDYENGKRYIATIGKIGAVYMFIQYAAYYSTHIVLHGYLPFLPVYHESYSQINYATLYQNMFRPTSFLLEPTHISRYLVVSLAVLLFDENQKNRWIWSFLISAAILASTSGTGLISVAIAWMVWLVYSVFRIEGRTKLPGYYLGIYFIIALAAIIAFNNSVVQSSLFRITNSNLLNINTAGGARFRGYVQYFELDTLHKIIGMGYGSTPNTSLVTWFSGASYMLYGTGFIGFMVCIVMFIKLCFKHYGTISKLLCVIFAFLFFADDCFMSHLSVLYLSFICLGEPTIDRIEGQ